MNIINTGIQEFSRLISPGAIREEIPLTDRAQSVIAQGRQDFEKILRGDDQRFVVILGPCSIHDPQSALEYAHRLVQLSKKYSDRLFIMMRAYFEKPRTTVGWKGLINDPYLNGTEDVEEGTRIARKLLIDIADSGLPTATELLDPITAAYIGELVSWVSIGARTTESQTHRQMASGLSAPVGFKNNSDGNIDVAINAMLSAKSPHSFLGVNDEGLCSVVRTLGNDRSHIILRGGDGHPNYSSEHIVDCEVRLELKGFKPRIMIDCSHENSGKDFRKQHLVLEDILEQKKAGKQSIFGVMIESHLQEGNQSISDSLEYGKSITDSCIGWEETEKLLEQCSNAFAG